MARITVAAESFSLVNRWSNGGYPKTASKSVVFNFSVPTGAVINQAYLTFYAGSPKYGGSCTVNDIDIEKLATNTINIDVSAGATEFEA